MEEGDSRRYSLVLYDCVPSARDGSLPVLFTSTDRWLHPLFQLEEYLHAEGRRERANYILYDVCVGLAAAYLLLHLRIPVVLTKLCTEGAKRLLLTDGVCVGARRMTSTIGCRTERILSSADVSSVAEAYRILCALRATAGKDRGSHVT